MHLHVQGLQEDGGQVGGVSVLLHERSQHGLYQPVHRHSRYGQLSPNTVTFSNIKPKYLFTLEGNAAL